MIVKGPGGSIRLTSNGRDVLHLAVHGELDTAMALQLTEALGVDPYVNGDRDVELDLSEVSFVDSTGIRLLLLVRSQVHASGHQLRITSVSQFAYRVLEISQLVDLLRVPSPETDQARPF